MDADRIQYSDVHQLSAFTALYYLLVNIYQKTEILYPDFMVFMCFKWLSVNLSRFHFYTFEKCELGYVDESIRKRKFHYRFSCTLLF